MVVVTIPTVLLFLILCRPSARLTDKGTIEHWGPNDEQAQDQQDLRSVHIDRYPKYN